MGRSKNDVVCWLTLEAMAATMASCMPRAGFVRSVLFTMMLKANRRSSDRVTRPDKADTRWI